MTQKPIASILLAAAFAALVSAQTKPARLDKKSLAERVDHFTFRSAPLGKPMAFTVVYPANYDPSRRDWPVLFFLHGLGRHERTLIDDLPSREKLLAQPYVIVLPKGENGWYFDSPTDEKRHYAAYLDEVIALAEERLPISKEKSRRAIGGWSAGGFGSVWACLRHPDSFSTLATIIAVVDHPSPTSNFPMPENTFGKDQAEWPKFNPISRVTELKGQKILLVIGDKATDAAMNQKMSDSLEAASIEHETVHLPGGHTWPTVQGGVGPVLDFVRKNITPGGEATTKPAEPKA